MLLVKLILWGLAVMCVLGRITYDASVDAGWRLAPKGGYLPMAGVLAAFAIFI
jgi:hypothetical protein